MVLSNSKKETRLHWKDLLHLRIRSACSERKYKINSGLRELAVYYSTLNKNQYEQNIMEITGRGRGFRFCPATWVWLVLHINVDSLPWTSVYSPWVLCSCFWRAFEDSTVGYFSFSTNLCALLCLHFVLCVGLLPWCVLQWYYWVQISHYKGH